MSKSDNVLSDSNPQFASLNLSLFLVLVCGVQMLHPDPKTIHLAQILQDKINGIVNIASLSLVWGILVWQLVLHHLEEIVSQKETSNGLLHSLNHV